MAKTRARHRRTSALELQATKGFMGRIQLNNETLKQEKSCSDTL